MKNYIYNLPITIIIYIFCGTHFAIASCDTFPIGRQTVTIPPITVPTNVKPGTVIWDSGFLLPPSGSNFATICTTSGSWGTRIPSGAKGVSGYSHVYKTSVDGVGIKIGLDNTIGHGDPIRNTSRLVTYIVGDVDAHMGYNKDMNTHIQLIATGAISGGELTFSSPFVEIFYEEDTAARLFINDTSINVKSHSCTVNGGNAVNVDLGNHELSEFKGVNYSTSSVDVPISLNCDKGTAITATVQADPDRDTTKQGAIKLISGGAKGVSVLLKGKNSNQVVLNSSFLVDTTTSEGQYSFDWKASYLQTLGKVTAGKANATATLQLSYN